MKLPVASKISSAFPSLTVRNFRLFTVGQAVSAIGTWMMIVAQDWLVLSLSSDSVAALGTVTALQFTPILLLTLYGGLMADRYDKRRLLVAANVAAGGLALLLAVLVLAGEVRLWHINLLALAVGCINAVETPARMAFVSEMVGPELLPNASAITATYSNVAQIVGPAGAGLLISAVGTGPVMVMNAVTFFGTVITLCLMRPAELHEPPVQEKPAAGAGVRDGLRYTAGRRDLVPVFGLVAAVSLFGFNFQLTLPLFAKTVFHTDAAAFGMFTTAMAVGSLLAALATAGRRVRPSARTVVVAALGFGAVEAAAGWAPTAVTAVVLLALTGFATLYFAQATYQHIQLGTDPQYRGRVMALYILIQQGSTPLGALLIGWLTTHLGSRSGLWAGGLISLFAALVTLLALRSAPAREELPGADGSAGARSRLGAGRKGARTSLEEAAAGQRRTESD
ncbi:MFS transporter [Streptomyces sp. NPDC051366]|uniref:MFS transporter n=1 Tax=Streptomyces sp. NPDC051366 TaxID=3365652 RepID=UPI00378CF2A2